METERTASESADATYNYLRLILVFPIALIAVASVLEALLVTHQFRDSISDYYASPIRDLFVGGLMATAVCLIAYKGESKLEDYALNFAGFNAFFVALVPNNLTDVLEHADAASSAELIQSRSEIIANLRVSLVSLLVLATVFVILDARFFHWTPFDWRSQQPLPRVLVVVSWVTEIGLVAVVVAMLAGVEKLGSLSTYGFVHFGAATLLIGNLSFAVASHGWPEQLRLPQHRPATRAAVPSGGGAAVAVAAPPEAEPTTSTWLQPFYRTIVALMWAGLVIGGICIARKVPYSVIVTEYAEIVLFIVFWVVATRASWRRASVRS